MVLQTKLFLTFWIHSNIVVVVVLKKSIVKCITINVQMAGVFLPLLKSLIVDFAGELQRSLSTPGFIPVRVGKNHKIKYSCYKLLIMVYNSNNPRDFDLYGA